MSRLSELGFQFDVGDVVNVCGQDLWLERGNLVRDGERPYAVLFETRETPLWHPALAEPALYRLRPVEAAELARVPLRLELRQSIVERRSKRAVSIEALNGGALGTGEAVLAEYRGLGGVLLVVNGQRGCHGWWADAIAAHDLARY